MNVLMAPLNGRTSAQISFCPESTRACFKMWPAEREMANPANPMHNQKRYVQMTF